jgi:hypothetical protein
MSASQSGSAEQLIERLARLTRGDRDWILAHLSAGAKANLKRQLGQVASHEPTDRPAIDDGRALDAVDADSIASHLAGEPSWLIAMIMNLRAWRWESHVLAKLPAVTRLEVNQQRGSLPALSAAMQGLLVRTLREQLPGQNSHPRFDQLLDRETERAP